MAEQTTAQQASAVYRLTSPDGFDCVWNDPDDPDYVFPLTGDEAVSGLDSAEVRTAIYDRIEAHGAIGGTFFHATRPITLSGELVAADIATRNARESKLRKAVNNCMGDDGALIWTPDGSIEQYVKVRKYQPMRVRGGWKKDIFTSLVALDPFIYSTELETVTGNHATNLTAENQGNDFGPPELITVHGPGTDPTIKRTWDSVAYDLVLETTLTSTQFIQIDPMSRTILRADDSTPTEFTNIYSALSFEDSTWWLLGPGDNTLRVDWGSGATAASDLTVDWRHTWL